MPSTLLHALPYPQIISRGVVALDHEVEEDIIGTLSPRGGLAGGNKTASEMDGLRDQG